MGREIEGSQNGSSVTPRLIPSPEETGGEARWRSRRWEPPLTIPQREIEHKLGKLKEGSPWPALHLLQQSLTGEALA